MTASRIGDLAKRHGVSTPTLRYYEELGLVRAQGRTPSGYRLYGTDADWRLELIARAKGLGLSLEEIKELIDICSGEGCVASRERLGHILAHKIEEVRRQIAEQTAFQAQLEDAFTRLGEGKRATKLARELRLIESSDCTCGDAGCPTEACSCDCDCCAEGVS